ncbi:MAG: DUF58 domain-containing protein [Bacteroidales bacterium]|nr:DUF58 domain-containing protein [Bacteroidales bacterium]
MESNYILKQVQKFGNLELVAHQVVEGFITGLHKSPFHGFSVEFAEHRIYNPGESTKYIDWKLFARSDKLFIKRFEEETNLRCQLVIDNSSSMYYPEIEKPSIENLNKISFSVYCAAVLMHLLKKQRDAFGLSLFSADIELHTPAKSSSVHQKILFTELEKILNNIANKEQKKTSAASVLHQIADSIHKRSLVVIFSDMLDNSEKSSELFNALQHLKHNKHEVILFHVTDKKREIDFNFENRPYKFIDMETGEEVKTYPSEIKETYIKSITDYKNLIKLKCNQYRIDFVEIDINKGFRDVLITYLLKRERMK